MNHWKLSLSFIAIIGMIAVAPNAMAAKVKSGDKITQVQKSSNNTPEQYMRHNDPNRRFQPQPRPNYNQPRQNYNRRPQYNPRPNRKIYPRPNGNGGPGQYNQQRYRPRYQQPKYPQQRYRKDGGGGNRGPQQHPRYPNPDRTQGGGS